MKNEWVEVCIAVENKIKIPGYYVVRGEQGTVCISWLGPKGWASETLHSFSDNEEIKYILNPNLGPIPENI